MDEDKRSVPDGLVTWTLIGFALVAGSMLFVWYLRHRAASTIDDPSILLAAPPDGMTPASATVVEGSPVRLAFIAGLIDLAGRGEITFIDDGDHGAGIQIGGADLSDARIRNNRRRPAGEAETWLLGQLELTAGHPHHAPWDSDAFEDLPFMVETAQTLAGAVLRQASETPDAEAGAAASEEREQGLLSGGGPDTATIERAYESETGHAMPANARLALASASAALSTPAVPDTAESDVPAPGSGDDTSDITPKRLVIPADAARALATPFLFGTFLDTYARRHGWLPSLPFLIRLRWRIYGIAAAAAGIAVLTVGAQRSSDSVTGLGLGVLLGGLFVIWRAPAMVQPTPSGGRVRAQLAAYRRTLELTLQSAASINDAVGPAGLPWMTTPDEAIAWSVALGLTPAVAQVLARSSSALTASAELPVSLGRFRRRRGASTASGTVGTAAATPAQLFAAIQAIGSASEALPSYLRPMRSWFS